MIGVLFVAYSCVKEGVPFFPVDIFEGKTYILNE